MALSGPDVACWLVKSAGWPDGLPRDPTGTVTLRRCLRPTYRLDLLRPGQPCVLWVSGRVEPGVGAVGWLASGVDVGVDGPGAGVHVELAVLPSAVPRADLVADARFRTAEVVRMAAGSNPSYLDAVQFEAVLDRLGPDAPAGWPLRR
ncbi:hypothetical protein [Kineococcus aurantiacus]|uniref:EVE domain-containing protein n=1 Tax=Kineococcus aurantiacus TaxID=37633 RepID=A0A7Y9J1J5_9ACTN|nr:hypothetical protein [Kineococcus aurantiacus]NYD23124.1 hypothetical protein [Kineococcus aurantiacus]